MGTVPPGRQPCWLIGRLLKAGQDQNSRWCLSLPEGGCTLHVQVSFRSEHCTCHLLSLCAAVCWPSACPRPASPFAQGAGPSPGWEGQQDAAAGCPWKISPSLSLEEWDCLGGDQRPVLEEYK